MDFVLVSASLAMAFELPFPKPVGEDYLISKFHQLVGDVVPAPRHALWMVSTRELSVP